MAIKPEKYFDLIPKAARGEQLKCPYCSSDNFKYGVIPYESDGNVGFIYFDCPDCKRLIHFSRIDFSVVRLQ